MVKDYVKAEVLKRLENSYTKLLGAYNLANHYSFYSDWYKDVNGYRPRDIF